MIMGGRVDGQQVVRCFHVESQSKFGHLQRFSIIAIILDLISNDFVESFKFSGSPKAVKKTWTLHNSRKFFTWIFPKNKESL